MTRKCVFTGKVAKSKGRTIPIMVSTLDELHNWANNVPINTEYLELKGNRMPTELEMEASETFHLLELLRLRVKFYENKLAEIQSKINELNPIPEPNKVSNTQIKKIENEVHSQDIVEDVTQKIKETLNKKKNLWGNND